MLDTPSGTVQVEHPEAEKVWLSAPAEATLIKPKTRKARDVAAILLHFTCKEREGGENLLPRHQDREPEIWQRGCLSIQPPKRPKPRYRAPDAIAFGPCTLRVDGARTPTSQG